MEWENGKVTAPLVYPGATVEMDAEIYGVWAVAHREYEPAGTRGVPWPTRERWNVCFAPHGEVLVSSKFAPRDGIVEDLKALIERFPQVDTCDELAEKHERIMEIFESTDLETVDE